MKKIVIFILVTVVSVLLVACGKVSETSQSNKDEISSTEKENEETELNLDQEKNNVSLPITYKVPRKNIYINAPNYQEIEQGYTELFIVHESKYVAITSDKKSTATTVKDAHDIAFAKFKTNMQNYEGGVNSISIEKEETKQINGIEVYCFEGKINYGRQNIYDGYAKGYAFIMDGVPCEIIGAVIDEDQSSALIDEIADVVDAMVMSVREEP